MWIEICSRMVWRQAMVVYGVVLFQICGLFIQIYGALIQIHGKRWAVVVDDVRMVVDGGSKEEVVLWLIWIEQFGGRMRVGGVLWWIWVEGFDGRMGRWGGDVGVLLLGSELKI
ncbi:hypothetical protein Adt_23752 [Abeliophyllum distichum]|uniref:Transmembrane protein n=1 Tax=Abeliophyllum distichum TaxID=126358 RepID=A0ABD1SES1_9LAMI